MSKIQLFGKLKYQEGLHFRGEMSFFLPAKPILCKQNAMDKNAESASLDGRFF